MSHQITYNDFTSLTTEVSLASSSDNQGNWKRLAAIVHVIRTDDTVYVLTAIGAEKPVQRFQFLSDAILAYNAEKG